MAQGVVSFGVKKLWDLLDRQSERLIGINKQVGKLTRELGSLESLLEDADAKKHESSKRVRKFLEDVQDIVYDAEDVIESFLLKEFRGKGIKKQARRLACFLIDRHKVASDIEGITDRISEVIREMQILGIQQSINGGGRSLSLQDRERKQREIRQTFAKGSESDLVGVEQSVKELVGHLVEKDNIQVVSISGMGGIGKTTLARQVFHHDVVRRHFHGFAWVCVSQQFTQKQVWQKILQELQPHDGEVLQMDESTLQRKLFQLLESSRYLVVLDDVWRKEDWDRIEAAFPRKRGWKMLLTSRNEGVGLHADPTCYVFRPRILTPEESWKLCERIVFPMRDEIELKGDEEMEAMGKGMVTYCGGLPLAIKVLGGLLAKKHTVPEWKRVYENIGPRIVGKSGLDDDNLSSVNRVLSLSYEDLPMHLKHCFLYFAHFPEDYKVNIGELFSYWAAEGIITSFYEGSTIRDSGEDYLEELVRRNIIIAEKSYLNARFESCQMHDMMREVCLSKAKEENFLQVIKGPTSTSTINAQSPSRSRRLVVHSGNALHMLVHRNNQKVRSLLFFGGKEDLWIQSARGLRSLPLLRVLDLSKVQFEGGKLPSSIGELIHLRYLSLEQAKVSHLPYSLRNLKRLLYLNLFVVGKRVDVPNVFKEMLELRYLFLPSLQHDKTNLELGDLVNLEHLWYFSTKHSSVTDLLRMTKLRFLAVSLSDKCIFETITSSLSELRNLETLELLVFDFGYVAEFVGDFVLDFIHLKQIGLAIHMPRFPDQLRFPPHLARISLYYCQMEEDPMPVLERLLHLKSVELRLKAFIGKRMVCSEDGFPQLWNLEISEVTELEDWIVEEGSMPCLRTLAIRNCKKLKALPDGLKYITALKELKIEGMKKEWKEKVVPGGEDYYKVQHIPNVQFINCDDE